MTVPLEYAQRRTRSIIGRRPRLMLGIAFALVAAVTLYVAREHVVVRVLRVYWGRKCLDHVAPPGVTLVETDPVRADALVRSARDYVFAGAGLAVYCPEVWRRFVAVEPRAADFVPSIALPAPITFLGERRSPNGRRWLLVIAGSSANALDLPRTISALVLAPPNLLDKLPEAGGFTRPESYTGRWVHAELHPGMPDSSDASHLSIKCDIYSGWTKADSAIIKQANIDVYVQDDGTLKWILDDLDVVERTN